MKEDIVTVHVRSFLKMYEFVFTAHHSEATEDRQIEDGFYRATPPSGVHFEAEIRNFNDFTDEQHWGKVHHHLSIKTGKQYVCWTGQIENRVQLKAMLHMWCTGSVYTLEHGVQFEKLLDDTGIELTDFDACRQFFDQLGIHIKYTPKTAIKESAERPNYHFAKTN